MSDVVDVLFYPWCGGCLVWWMSGVVDVCVVDVVQSWLCGVVDVWCGECPFFTHGVVDVWCGGCLVWWMPSVVEDWCGGCPCGGCRTITF